MSGRSMSGRSMSGRSTRASIIGNGCLFFYKSGVVCVYGCIYLVVVCLLVTLRSFLLFPLNNLIYFEMVLCILIQQFDNIF